MKHDPSQACPSRPILKSTENTKPTTLGEGLWKTIKFIKFRGETVSDPTTGQITYWGAVQEDHVSLLMLRLKIVGGKNYRSRDDRRPRLGTRCAAHRI